jgi:16S rRNA processing protein RimM
MSIGTDEPQPVDAVDAVDAVDTAAAGSGDADDRVLVGIVGAPHGLRGEVAVRPYTDDVDARFAAGTVLLTGTGRLTVTHAHPHGGRLLVRFAGVDDRGAAEALRGVELLISAASRPVLPDPDDYYDSDLIGLRASTVGGAALGPVRDVVHAAGGDYLVVDVAGRERLVPFVAAVVPVVDLAAGVVIVDAPEGLFEL